MTNDTSKTLTDEFEELSYECSEGIMSDEQSKRYWQLKEQILRNQEIVERLEKRYEQFGDLTIGEMTIRSWTPGNVTSLLEQILGRQS